MKGEGKKKKEGKKEEEEREEGRTKTEKTQRREERISKEKNYSLLECKHGWPQDPEYLLQHIVGVQYADAKLRRVTRSSCRMDVHQVEIRTMYRIKWSTCHGTALAPLSPHYFKSKPSGDVCMP